MSEIPVSLPAAERFSAEQAVAAGTDFAELRVGPQGLFWNEFRPRDGACRIWHWRHGQAHCLTPDGFSVRSRVYEYGGGSFCLSDDGLVFVNESDQQIYTQELQAGVPQPLTQGERRYGDLRWAAGQVLAVEETHAADQVEHRLVGHRCAAARGTRRRCGFLCRANPERRWLTPGMDRVEPPRTTLDRYPPVVSRAYE